MLNKTIVTALIAICLLMIVPSAFADSEQTYSNYIYQGQTSMHVITLNCPGQLTLTAPYGSNYDIYAMKGSGSWTPDDDYILSHYDKASVSYGQTEQMSLDAGTWYIIVYSINGFGQYSLKITSNCQGPVDPCQNDPNCGPCSPFKVDTQTGFLNTGEVKTYAYEISGDRNYIEWILQGPCGDVIPVVMMTVDEVSSMRTSYCGTNFDLYIYKDCDPRYDNCYAPYADTADGSNAYVGVANPSTGSTYYAQVYAKQGSGAYSLLCRSFDCQSDVVMMSMSTAENVSGPVGFSE